MHDKNRIPLWSFLLLNYLACTGAPSSRTFLVPSDYQGTLRIIYDETCGASPEKEKDGEVYTFGSNGVVILKADMDSRITNAFYLVDQTGRRTKVNPVTTHEERVHNMPAILTGGVVVSSNVVNLANSKQTRVAGGATCMDFYLYNKDTTRIDASKFSEALDVRTNALVNACREQE